MIRWTIRAYAVTVAGCAIGGLTSGVVSFDLACALLGATVALIGVPLFALVAAAIWESV